MVVVDIWSSMRSKAYVYTSKSKSWELIDRIPYRIYHDGYDDGVFFNGSLHWLARAAGQDSTVLICSDTVNERFQKVEMPEASIPYPEEPLGKNRFHGNVGASGDCLCLVFHVFNVRIGVWIKQDYEVRESWAKSFSITHESIVYVSNVLYLESDNKRVQANTHGIRKEFDGCGFGYDYKTGDYKLVTVVFRRATNCSDINVYTLRSGSWKTIQRVPYYLYNKYLHEGVFFNGALHWFAHTFGKDSTALMCFDIVNERSMEIALPETPMPSCPEEALKKDIAIDLGVLAGCLCLVFGIWRTRIDVWIMRDYGVRTSWAKSLSITQEIMTSNIWDLKLAWSFKNNETLWEVDKGFILYDSNSKLYRKLKLDSDAFRRWSVTRNHMHG
ncbi:uncharacterized protein LOC113325094 [Papaver somniferum]|uniref:uncharacterized protein LOC113325094 n=1 Tax=Papaver somniferum TaxID=3469 RepID=UPI000E6FF49B|nr:uncharacterized protein LOC113325094 [Papaver somniferum]